MEFNGNSNQFSDSSWDLNSLWFNSIRSEPLQPKEEFNKGFKTNRSVSYIDVRTNHWRDDVMQEFRMNGIDSPFDPEEDLLYGQTETGLSGMGPSSLFLRQKSWPSPELTPLQQLPRHQYAPAPSPPEPSPDCTRPHVLTEEQRRVLCSLPRPMIRELLKDLDNLKHINHDLKFKRSCAFCRSNGERAAWCESHVLRVGGRVCCPVLRAFVCQRCGARGDDAHTIKYCPQATYIERQKSAAIMRSIREATGRRRALRTAASLDAEYFRCGQVPLQGREYYDSVANLPLDEAWAAVERKLIANN